MQDLNKINQVDQKLEVGDVVNSIQEGQIDIKEVVDAIVKKISKLTFNEVFNTSELEIKKLIKIQSYDEEKRNRIDNVSEYFEILNDEENIDKILIAVNGKTYIKMENSLYEIKYKAGKTYITYNNLTEKYTIFSYTGHKFEKLF